MVFWSLEEAGDFIDSRAPDQEIYYGNYYAEGWTWEAVALVASTSRSASAGRSSARAAIATPRMSSATTSPASEPSTVGLGVRGRLRLEFLTLGAAAHGRERCCQPPALHAEADPRHLPTVPHPAGDHGAALDGCR
jgi:hypothetical protein